VKVSADGLAQAPLGRARQMFPTDDSPLATVESHSMFPESFAAAFALPVAFGLTMALCFAGGLLLSWGISVFERRP
jgi:hypothetical protein